MNPDWESSFSGPKRDDGSRKRGLIDEDRTTTTRSLSIYTIGDMKFFWVTTGVVAVNGSATVYLTSNGTAGGDNLFTNSPLVSVRYDGNGEAGGFVRGQGPEKPGSAYIARDRGDIWVDEKWIASNEVFAVVVTNKSGSAADFVVKAQGV